MKDESTESHFFVLNIFLLSHIILFVYTVLWVLYIISFVGRGDLWHCSGA